MSRLHVTIACAVSLDGKLSTGPNDRPRFASRRDRKRLHALRDGADAILVGAATLRAEDPPLLPTPERARARENAGRRPFPVRAVVSRTLDLPLGRALTPHEGSPVYVFTGDSAPADRRVHLEKHGAIVRTLDLAAALDLLASEEKVKRVLCEGGGRLNAGLIEAGLVDELELTLAPVVIGGSDAPSLVSGKVFPADRLPRAELVSCEATPEGEVFLRYRFPGH